MDNNRLTSLMNKTTRLGIDDIAFVIIVINININIVIITVVVAVVADIDITITMGMTMTMVMTVTVGMTVAVETIFWRIVSLSYFDLAFFTFNKTGTAQS